MTELIERFYIEGLPNKNIYGSTVSIGVNPWPDTKESRKVEKLLNQNEEYAKTWLRKNFIGPDIPIVRYYVVLDLDYHLQLYQLNDNKPKAPMQKIYDGGYTAALPDGGNVVFSFYAFRIKTCGPVRTFLQQSRTPYYIPPPGKDGVFSINLNITSLDCPLWIGAGRSNFFYKYNPDGSLLFDGRNIIRLLPPSQYDTSVSDDELKFGSTAIDYAFIKSVRNSTVNI